MDLTLKELADYLEGTFTGDPDLRLTGAGPIEAAEPGQVSFLANPKYARHLETTRASAVLVFSGLEAETPAALIHVMDPYYSFARVLRLLEPEVEHPGEAASPEAWVHPTATVDPSAKLYPFVYVGPRARVGAGTVLYPGVYVGQDASIGAECTLFANVNVAYGVRIGDRVVLHPGVTVGADGFGFAKSGTAYYKIPQIGTVEIADDVEIGANSCIDRATMGVTRIDRGVKIDDLVMVAHNCEIGEDSALVAQSGLSGSTKVGKRVAIGPKAGSKGHLSIADDVMVVGTSAVHKDISDAGVYGGVPAIPYRTWQKNLMSSLKVAEMRKQLARLEREVEGLRAALGAAGDRPENEEDPGA